MEDFGGEVEEFGLGLEEGDCGGVVWVWVGCVDSEVLLETGYGGFWMLVVVVGGGEEREGEEEGESLEERAVVG